MTEVSIQIEFPSSLHVKVTGAKSERSAVQLSRNFASKHYGTRVGHWVSGGGGSLDGEIYYTYVYSNPSYVPEVTPEPVIPDKPLKLQSTTLRTPAARPGLNARQRRAMRNGADRYSVMAV